MRRLRLTPENQLLRFQEDMERVAAKRPMDFSIGAHIQLLIKRVDALERAASGIAARSDETAQPAQPEGQEPGPKGDAQGQPS